MDELITYLPLILPLLVVQFGLAIFALFDLLKQTSYRRGNRIFWIVIVLFISIIGPILYFTLGKESS